MNRIIFLTALTVSLSLFTSCESDVDKQLRLAEERRIEYAEKQRIEKLRQEETAKAEALEKAAVAERERVEEERLALEKRILAERAIRAKYINNSLSNGSKPYSSFFGSYNSCDGDGCSKISVKTPHNSDVLVTIKKNGIVYRHAYIKAGNTYTFNFPNGTYQPFFYYGKGWNPNKEMKMTSEGMLTGGFIEYESFGKDSPQKMYNEVLTYTLILQQNGNFSTKPSNSSEAL